MIVVGIINEGLTWVINQRSDRATFGVDSHDPHHVMSSLVVVKGESAGVLFPTIGTDVPWVGEKRFVKRNLLLPHDVEQMRLGLGNLVARFEIAVRMQLRLQLILGRGLDKVDNALLSLLVTKTNQFLPVRGPLKVALITVAFLSVRC